MSSTGLRDKDPCHFRVSGSPGFDPALTPSVKVSSLLLQPGGFFFRFGRRSVSSLSPAAGFEVRPKESAGKIERPTAVRTVFEGPGG
jgi:hypothetical protein